MKVFDVYFKGGRTVLMRKGLTEEQVDKFFNTLKWWEKQTLEVKAREIPEKDEQER